MPTHRGPLLGAALVLLLAPVAGPEAQVNSGETDYRLEREDLGIRRALPFRVGEHHEFEVHFGRIRAGSAQLTVTGQEMVRGVETMRFDFTVRGGIPFARVNNRMSSWSEVRPFRTLRFEQDLDEVGTERYRRFEIYPEARQVRLAHNGNSAERLPSALPLDDVSFLYYARTLPLEVGDRYYLPHYFRDSGNPVVLEVLRKDEVSVPAGRYSTIVVRPTFQTSGLFGEGGEAEIHFSDDASRVVVKVTSRVSRIGSLHLNLARDPRLP
ncbi:MAG: DUF3108 domain-containing protein [Gemmatimonadota bacterium]